MSNAFRQGYATKLPIAAAGGSATWGTITGTLSNQTDLQAALDAKAAVSHTHLEADITDLQAYLLDAPSDGTTYGRKDGAWAAIVGGGGGLNNVVEDLTPQLGGDLDVNGQQLVSVSNGDIGLAPHGTGNVQVIDANVEITQGFGISPLGPVSVPILQTVVGDSYGTWESRPATAANYSFAIADVAGTRIINLVGVSGGDTFTNFLDENATHPVLRIIHNEPWMGFYDSDGNVAVGFDGILDRSYYNIPLWLKEIASVATPVSGYGIFRAGTDGKIYWKNDAGTEYDLTQSGGGAEVNDLTAAVTWANVPDANITQSSVTQHEAALTITESQISDLDHDDIDAIHDNIAGEIALIAEKTSFHLDDLFVIEDSEATNNKKRIKGATILEKVQLHENGFENRTDSTISFVDGTRTFTIAPAVSTFSFYSGGTKFTKSSSENVVITDTEGLWFIYYNESGVLTATQTFVDEIILDYAFVSVISWDATNNTGIIVADERHGHTMDSMTHLYNHNTTGARFGSGLLVADVVAEGSGNDDSHAQFSYGIGEIWDEDLKISIAGDAAPASVPIFYRSGVNGDWRKIAATNFVSTTTGSGRAAWNEDTGATWQLTEITNNDFFLMHLYATNDTLDGGMILVMGQAEYPNGNTARAAAPEELLSLELAGLPVLEIKSVATFILQSFNGYTNAVKARIRSTDDGDDYIDWRFISTGVIVSVAGAAAGDLDGLSDVSIAGVATYDHLEYSGTVWQNVVDLTLANDLIFTAQNPQISLADATGALDIVTGGSSGSAIEMFGGTHATKPGYIEMASDDFVINTSTLSLLIAEFTETKIDLNANTDIVGNLEVSSTLTVTSGFVANSTQVDCLANFDMNGNNIFDSTGQNVNFTDTIRVTATVPRVRFNESDQAADNKEWQWVAQNATFYIQAMTDAGAGGGNNMVFTRDDQQINEIEFRKNATAWLTIDNFNRKMFTATGAVEINTTELNVSTQVTIEGAAPKLKQNNTSDANGSWIFRPDADQFFVRYPSDSGADNVIKINTDGAGNVNEIEFKYPVELETYTVATIPAASSTGRLAFVSDGDAGSQCLAVDNGTNWKVVSLGATISAT